MEIKKQSSDGTWKQVWKQEASLKASIESKDRQMMTSNNDLGVLLSNKNACSSSSVQFNSILFSLLGKK